jgi:hypothetical protein
MNRRKAKIIPANQNKLKSMWKAQKSEYIQSTPTKTYRKFNQTTASAKNKIILNRDTWIERDYNPKGNSDTHRLVKKDEKEFTKDTFKLPTYPILRLITNEMPDNDENLKDMDTYLIKSIHEIGIWNNQQFEFL